MRLVYRLTNLPSFFFKCNEKTQICILMRLYRKIMETFRKIFFAALLSMICLAACQKDDTLRYSNVTMGNITDGVFISDQGNRFDIKEQTCPGILDTMKRVIVTCDVLTQTGESTYDIRLNGFASVFTKAPVDSTSVTDADIFVEDPLMVHEMWCSGGYINMYIFLPVKVGSRTSHLINLVRNDKDAAPGTYEFTLKHNAFGEVPTADGSGYTIGGTYVSFPVAGLFAEDKVDIVIHWNSGKEDKEDSDAEDKRNSLIYKWEKGGYEHSNHLF